METLFLILLTFIVFYRLWAVLGTRTGHEKQNHDWIVGQYNEQNQNGDNLIILPQKNDQKPDNSMQDHEAQLHNALEFLKTRIADFDADSFLKGAVRAFEYIVISFAKGDLKKIKSLLAKPVYKKFEDVIKLRLERGDHVDIEVGDIIPSFIRVDSQEDKVLITVQFQSEQMVATVSQDGQIYDNPSRLKSVVLDTWTFVKSFDSIDNIWLLLKTEAKPL